MSDPSPLIHANDVRRLDPDRPVFELASGSASVFYAPGALAAATSEQARQVRAALRQSIPTHPTAQRLVSAARMAAETWSKRMASPFRPRTLVVYVGAECALDCGYCFTAGLREPDASLGAGVLSGRAVLIAARHVLKHCARAGEPFRLVVPGAGEPALALPLLEHTARETRSLASQTGVPWSGHVATSGVMSDEQARRLAVCFDSVGLSCDGPPDIQDKQRPLRSGGATSRRVEGTSRVLRSAGARLSVRATITPETVERQVEIVEYLFAELGARTLRFEPVYRTLTGGRAAFEPSQAAWFARHFLMAQRRASKLGGKLTIVGIRIDETHGPFCSTLNNALHLALDGAISTCFFAADGKTAPMPALVVGRVDEVSGELWLDHERIACHRQQAGEPPRRCRECLCVLHCARECPEHCYALSGPADPSSEPGFRCRLHRRLAEAWILEAASPLLDKLRPSSAAPAPVRMEMSESVARRLRTEQARLDTAALLAQWEPVKDRLTHKSRALPAPIWVKRGFDHDGAQAWSALKAQVACSDAAAPVSIYVHVPFCDRRCPFCDCHSRRLASRDRDIERAFEQALLREVGAWASLRTLQSRPVTTVHFGGGTPNCLRTEVLLRIVRRLRESLAVHPETEWALESTSSRLTVEELEALSDLGFRRLHVGVQTLDDEVRRRIGRRGLTVDVLERLTAALTANYTVSLDLIYGLPGQTLNGFLRTIEQLVAVGVHGFSLYQLQTSERNRRFLERHRDPERSQLTDYLMFAAADQFLSAHGFAKNHFVHFAGPKDQDLYYRHAVRGEDLLALGPTADGVFGAYHYRHPELEAYFGSQGNAAVPLEGGVRESSTEQRTTPLVSSLMGATANEAELERLCGERLGDRWRRLGFVRQGGAPGELALTANGSWFIAEMIDELRDADQQGRAGSTFRV